VNATLTPPPRNCRFLLGSLIGLLVSFPFLEDVARPLILVILVAAVFVAAVIAVDSGRINITRALVIAVSQVALTVVSLVQHETNKIYKVSVTLALLATAVLILFATYCVLGYVLRAQIITLDQIYAGICMYLMLGFAFGAMFYLINILDPNSFIVNNDLMATRGSPDLMYFSFVTLATLGYGDITPSSNLARSLAVVDALAGMLYIAVFMARLVSLRSTSAETD
jgi:hypothetical protein